MTTPASPPSAASLRAGVLTVVTTSVLWGTTGTAAAFAPDAGPLAIGSAALGIGGLLQALIALPALHRARGPLRSQARTVAVGAVAVAVYPLAFYSSMRLAGVAIGSIVSLALAPLATGVIERVVGGRRLGARWLACALVGALGAGLLVVSRDDGSAGSPLRTAVGAAIGVLAAATYAAYSWVSHRLMAAGTPRGAAMGAVFGAGGLLLMPVLAVTGAPLVATREATAVAVYMVMSRCSSATSSSAWAWPVCRRRRRRPSRCSSPRWRRCSPSPYSASG